MNDDGYQTEDKPLIPAGDEAQPTAVIQPGKWIDLAAYMVVGIGLFLIGSLVVGQLVQGNGLLASAALYGTNILVFGGTVLVVGVLRRRLSLAEIGFWPPRLPGRWISLAAALALFFMPIRAGLALLAEWIVKGNLAGLNQSPRMDIFAPAGFSWVNFLATLLLAGILVPIAEELFFRGALYTWLRSRMAPWVAMLLSAGLFGLGHADTFAVVISSFVLGIINAWLFERSRTLWAPITVHIVNNSLAVIALYAALLTGNLAP
ncbi:MAG TPA: type II CAAX endopeptidase family protein [Anaerolineaceae bacterium]|nr:type II CAAX endopeptidase family protein [Anaerolineaceae bacterium]